MATPDRPKRWRALGGRVSQTLCEIRIVMDPISLVLSALVNGATAGLQDSASSAVKDAYGKFKSYLKQKFGKVPIEQIEKDPEDIHAQEFAAQIIEREQCGQDKVLLALASKLIEVIGTDSNINNSINLTNSEVSVTSKKGNVLVGSVVDGNVTYTNQEFNHRSPNQRFVNFKQAPEYNQYLNKNISRGVPIRFVFLFIFGIPFLLLFGVGVLIMGYALYKIFAHGSMPLKKFPAIVTHKESAENDSFTPLRFDLLKEDGSISPVVVPRRLYNSISMGSIGVAYVDGSQELREFVNYNEL